MLPSQHGLRMRTPSGPMSLVAREAQAQVRRARSLCAERITASRKRGNSVR